MRMACKATSADENGAEVGDGVSGTVEAAEQRKVGRAWCCEPDEQPDEQSAQRARKAPPPGAPHAGARPADAVQRARTRPPRPQGDERSRRGRARTRQSEDGLLRAKPPPRPPPPLLATPHPTR